MSLETPEKIRSLQRKLYGKAKAEPAFRFYILYDKICREDVLGHAYALARANAGAPGVDGGTFAQIEAWGVEAWLAGLREDLVAKTYRADAVRRVMIPKPGGGERPLGIPTIRDRGIKTAAKIVLEPVFEADFEDSAYGTWTMHSSIAGARRRRGLCWRPSGVVWRTAVWSFMPRRPGSSTARTTTGRGSMNTSRSTSSAPPSNRDGRRTGGGDPSSASCRRSAPRPRRRSGRPSATGGWRPPGITSAWRIWLALRTRWCGAG